ncbi:FAD/NAD(P)-binding:oxidoreductase [Puteibacter caeruleilacunae]|nr:FAD/NAD(P)-binding:oxidoreductase [Puteibacter caeruleilacunae]
MGIKLMIMENKLKTYNRIAAVVAFIGLPIFLWTLSDVPSRTFLKDAISLLTLIAFSCMLMQFYLARSNNKLLKVHRMGSVMKWHKAIGYVFVTVLLFHPLLIVVPRYFEAGIEREEAFVRMITTFDNPGIVLGLIAWCLMLILGLTSMLRKQLPITYKTWRIFHGILSIAFIVCASWHVIMLGRHIDMAMTLFMLTAATIGIFLLLRNYFLPTPKNA